MTFKRTPAGRFAAWSAGVVAVALLLAGCSTPPDDSTPDEPTPSLRDAAGHRLRVGTAVEGITSSTALTDPVYAGILAREFSSLTPENQMKWGVIHPAPDEWNFGPADEIVDFAARHGQTVRGHTLLWHGSNPAWITDSSMTCADMRSAARDHVTTLVSRYRGKVSQWDVANEIFDESGAVRDGNPFVQACGVGIVADAFRWAHAADPEALLFLNDYSAEGVNARSDAYYAFTRELLDDGVPIHGYGVQGHVMLKEGVPRTISQNFARFAGLGLAIAVTEADVRMAWSEGDDVSGLREAAQAAVYGDLLDACLNEPACRSFTVWGFTDRYSWVPEGLEGQGSATVMTSDYERKPAFDELVDRLADQD